MKLSDLVVVTTNEKKLAEINQILGTNHQASAIDIPEIQSLDLNEVITQKAKEAYKKLKKPVLVEDVSLEIRVKGKDTTTKATDAVAIYDGKSLKIFRGMVIGTLSSKNRGTHGFGFDKVFIPKGYKQTFAQMPTSLKNKISHRARALKRVKIYLMGRH